MTLLQTKIVDALRSGMRNVDVARKVGCSKSTVTYVKRQFMPALVVPCDEPPPPNYLAILKALKTGDYSYADAQLSAYAQLIKENSHRRNIRKAVLYLPRNGNYNATPPHPPDSAYNLPGPCPGCGFTGAGTGEAGAPVPRDMVFNA